MHGCHPEVHGLAVLAEAGVEPRALDHRLAIARLFTARPSQPLPIVQEGDWIERALEAEELEFHKRR